jgi:hypothetical protein
MTCLKSAVTCVAMVAFSPAFAASVMEIERRTWGSDLMH